MKKSRIHTGFFAIRDMLILKKYNVGVRLFILINNFSEQFGWGKNFRGKTKFRGSGGKTELG